MAHRTLTNSPRQGLFGAREAASQAFASGPGRATVRFSLTCCSSAIFEITAARRAQALHVAADESVFGQADAACNCPGAATHRIAGYATLIKLQEGTASFGRCSANRASRPIEIWEEVPWQGKRP